MKTIELKLGMTKAEVRALLGPPDDWTCPKLHSKSKKYRDPAVWVYGNLELTFWVKHYRTPYPGAVLIGVKEREQNYVEI